MQWSIDYLMKYSGRKGNRNESGGWRGNESKCIMCGELIQEGEIAEM